MAAGIVPTFHVIGFATPFADAAMSRFGKDLFIGVPKVTEGAAPFVLIGDSIPQFATSLLATISDHKRHNLARAATNRDPQPPFIRFFQDK